jgi:hypothetical protein
MAHCLVIGVLLMLLSGCDLRPLQGLEAGVSTEDDVRTRLGAPAAVHEDGNGARTLEYPRQPAGQVNYMVSIGPDGRVTALRQVLNPTEFAKVTPGLTKQEVRRLLGRPAKVQAYALKAEEVWDWRFASGTEGRLFSVTFDADGRVVSTATTRDPHQSADYSG